MPVNPNISLAVRGLELPDPVAQYGRIAAIQQAQQQNQLAQLQMQQAQREQESINAMNRAYAAAYSPQTGEVDVNKLRESMATGGHGYKMPAIEKTLGELKTQRLTQAKTETELIKSRLEQSRQFLEAIDPNDPNAPEQFLAWHKSNHADPILGPALKARGITPEQSFARIQQAIQQGPQAIAQMLLQSKLGIEKFAELNKTHFVSQDAGGTTRVLAMPGMGGPAVVVPGSTATKTMAPGESERIKISRGQLKVAQEAEARHAEAVKQQDKVVTHTTTDEAGNVTLYNRFGQVIPATSAEGAAAQIKGKPSATFEKVRAQREQITKDLTFAVNELKEVTKDGGLIDQSTGSGAGRAIDVAAGFFGSATPGAIAIAKLKPIADLALKMVPRFEGPQSDKDTQSYKEAAGQLADPTLPNDIRKAAGKTVLRLMQQRKQQFVTLEMDAAGVGPGAVDTNNPLLK